VKYAAQVLGENTWQNSGILQPKQCDLLLTSIKWEDVRCTLYAQLLVDASEVTTHPITSAMFHSAYSLLIVR